MIKTYFNPAAVFCFFLIVLLVQSCKKDSGVNNNVVNNTDSVFIINASYSNNAEVGAGQLATSKGSADSVNMFGLMMISDHTTAQVSLDSIANSLNITTPGTPNAAHIAKTAYLQTLSGHTFDTAYINAQVIDHQATVAIFQQEISNGNDKLVKDFATTHLPIIQGHLQEALTIQAQLQ